MKKLLNSTATAGLISLGTMMFLASEASGVSFGNSWDGGTPYSLQKQLDAIAVQGLKIDTLADQTNFELFTSAGGGSSVATIMLEIAGLAPTNNFGIYNRNGLKAQLFQGSNSVSDGALLSFNNGNLAVTKGLGNTSKDYLGFGNIFGFYLERGDGVTFYTEKARNPNQSQQSVVYRGNNQTVLQIPGHSPETFTPDQFIIAFDDLLRVGGVSDGDYQDMVVLVDSIEPESVPESSTTVAMLGLGMCGIGLILKRLFKAQSVRRGAA